MKNFNSYSDKELNRLIRTEKPDCDRAFTALYERYSKKLNAFCLFLAQNRQTAEEIFHDAWLHYFKFVRSDGDVDNVLSFLISTAKNLLVDFERQSKRERENKDDYAATIAADIERGYAPDFETQAELTEIIRLAVDSLDEKYKEAFVLRRYEQLSHEEIAKITGSSPENVRQRVSRASAMIRRVLEPYFKGVLII